MTIKSQKLLLIVLLFAGALSVASTYMRLSETDDELFHIDCGMEWWGSGTYTMETLHPPLARIVDATLPYWLNVDSPQRRAKSGESNRDTYLYRMVTSRLGVLPFYFFSCLLVYAWSRKLFGNSAALWSLGLYITLSTVTAHAGLATTDMVYTTMLLWSLLSAVYWLEKPDIKRSLIFGLSLGLAICSKFSTFAQWPAAITAILIGHIVLNYYKKQNLCPINKTHIKNGMIYALPMVIIVIALIYHFSYESFRSGIEMAMNLNKSGFSIWLFERTPASVWYFFPVVFFFKTPLPFFVASVVGAWCSGLDPKKLSPLLAAIGIMAISMTSNINLGVRHVLPLYPLLAIPAGYGLLWLWQQSGWKRVIACILLLWQVGGFINFYPEHISYFNELAGDHPEHITIDSDYDWGQEAISLSEAVTAHKIDSLYLCVRRNAFSDSHILLDAEIFKCPKEPVSGWVAVGRAYRLEHLAKFTWPDEHSFVQRIGRTMDLYYIPPK